MKRTQRERRESFFFITKKFIWSSPAFFIFLIFLSLFPQGCSSTTSIYDFNFSLSSKTVKAKTANLQMQIPQGWFSSDDENNKTVELWLVRDDYEASIAIKRIFLDQSAVNQFGSYEFDKVVKTQKAFIKANLGKDFSGFSNEEYFQINDVETAAFQHTNTKGEIIRRAVFKFQANYFEATAISIKPINSLEVFKAQNSLLASIK